MMQLFAHAGEVHASTAEASGHLLQEWYIALPLFILVVAGFASIVYFLSHRSKPSVYIWTVALLFVSGVVMYDKSAVVSITALASGMALVLVSVIVSLAKSDKE